MSLPVVLQQGTGRLRAYRIVTWALFLLIVLALPLFAAETRQFGLGDNTFTFGIGNLNHAISYMVAVLGLSLLIGFSGQISLGNSFFVGVGAYLTAVLVTDFDWPYLLTLVVVVPVCFLIGMLVGVPALRIRGLYLALVTLALAAVFPSIVRLEQLTDRTGGSNGLRVESDLDPPSWFPLDGIAEFFQALPGGERYFGEDGVGGRAESAVWTYFLLVAVAAVCFWLVKNLIASRPGRAIVALRDNETSAAINGISPSLYKTQTFGFSAALGGVAGTMYVMALQFVAPDVFGINLAIFLIVGLVVGGVGTLSGAVVGGFIIIFIPHWAAQAKSVPGIDERYLRGPTGTALLGILLIILTFVLPGGIVWGVRRLRARFVRIAPAGVATTGEISSTDTAGHQAVDILDARHSEHASGI